MLLNAGFLVGSTWALLSGVGEEKPGEVTYHRDVAPILHQHCAVCHREGEVAPFPLLSYEDAAKRVDWLVEIVQSRRMPPWKAEPNFGHFIGERRLSDKEIATLTAWAQAGAPEGSPADTKPVPSFPSGWSLGEPDLILEAPHEVTVPASGPDVFHHFIVSIGEAADREVAAVEFRPGNPRAVHHAVILLDEAGLGRVRDNLSPEPGYETEGTPGVPLTGILTIWAPGVTARRLPEDIAIKMPSKGDIVVQLHLHPSGKEEKDRSRIGIYFSKKPAERFVMDRPLLFGPVTLDIPAGAKEHDVQTELTLPVDLWLTAILPHMHLIGKEMKISATLPNGEAKPLIWIRDWDFNWQDQYVYQEPVHLPAGSVIRVSGTYDNSADNPANPRRPPERVTFGEATNDEMCLAIFQAVAANPGDSKKVRDAIAGNVFKQIREPNVDPELKKFILAQLRELGQSELKSMVRERLQTILAPQPKG